MNNKDVKPETVIIVAVQCTTHFEERVYSSHAGVELHEQLTVVT